MSSNVVKQKHSLIKSTLKYLFVGSFLLINSTERSWKKILFQNVSMCCECRQALYVYHFFQFSPLPSSSRAEIKITEAKQLTQGHTAKYWNADSSLVLLTDTKTPGYLLADRNLLSTLR